MAPGGRRRGRLFALAVALGSLACGPTVTPSGTEDGSGSGGTTITAGMNSTTSVTSTSGPGADTGVSTDTSTSDGAPGTVPMFEACDVEGEGGCVPELLCTPVSLLDGRTSTMCTAECLDPEADCDLAPEGWTTVCAAFLHVPPDPFCAIACGEDFECPEGMVCGVDIPFSEPYYCYPA